jgi:hypothetical protein
MSSIRILGVVVEGNNVVIDYNLEKDGVVTVHTLSRDLIKLIGDVALSDFVQEYLFPIAEAFKLQ